jgi:hypothetical protein
MRNRGGMGAGSMKMGGPGKKPPTSPGGIGTKMPGTSPAVAGAGGPSMGPSAGKNPLAGGPMPPIPGGAPGGMKKGGKVSKHETGGAVAKHEKGGGVGPFGKKNDKSDKEDVSEKYAKGGQVKSRVHGAGGYR